MRLPSSATKHSNHRSCPKPLSDSREASEPGSASPTWTASSRESSAIEAISSNDAWRILNKGSIGWDQRLILELLSAYQLTLCARLRNEFLDVPGSCPIGLLQQTMVPLKHKWPCCASQQISTFISPSGMSAWPAAEVKGMSAFRPYSDQTTSPLKPVLCFRNHT